MRKLTAIFFLLLLLFSNWGYRWMFNHLEKNATARLEQRIDNGSYADEQLMEVKIPLNMPYYSDRPYEQAYGEMQYEGNYYRYVKRKISQGTLYLLCLPHAEKNNLVAAENDYMKAIAGVNTTNEQPQKQQTPAFVKLLLSEFISNTEEDATAASAGLNNKYLSFNINCSPQFEPLAGKQPPRA